MLSNDYITKLINLVRVKFKGIVIQEDTLEILVDSCSDIHLCPHCTHLTSRLIDSTPKSYRDIDCMGRRTYLKIDLRRFECSQCFHTFTEKLSFADAGRQYTKRFEETVYEDCRETTAWYTGSKYGLSDKTAAAIYEKIVKEKQQQLILEPIRRIGIDEIAMHKGHQDFVLVITDLTNKRVLEVLPDRKKKTLEEYFRGCTEEFKEGIEVVATDLWSAYRSVVEELLPRAMVVADRFHVMQNLNKALDRCRKQEKLNNEELGRESKYVLLKNGESLTEEQKRVLSKVLEESKPLKRCYELKESFRAIFNESKDREEGEKRLTNWVLEVFRRDAEEYYGFVKTLLRWENNILNYFIDWVSSGFVEGVNNKIKLIKRKAFGFINFGNFRTKIIDCFS